MDFHSFTANGCVCPQCFIFREACYLFCSGKTFIWCRAAEVDEAEVVGEGVFPFCKSGFSACV